MPYWFEPHTQSVEINGRTLTIETGRMAKQAAGAALVTYGETVVLVTAAHADPRPGIDFFPLTVDFVEKTSAAGKFPGGFFKREARLSDREILVCRFIDRSIRPLFADGYNDETQVIATVLSADGENPADVIGFLGASAALTISEIPFLGPIAGVRVGRVDGTLIANPTREQMGASDLEFVVAGSREALVMVEGEAKEVPEEELLAALRFGHETLIPLIDAQDELRRLAGKEKIQV
jgi:polyribonucleotide nucleotidyltransferase